MTINFVQNQFTLQVISHVAAYFEQLLTTSVWVKRFIAYLDKMTAVDISEQDYRKLISKALTRVSISFPSWKFSCFSALCGVERGHVDGNVNGVYGNNYYGHR